MIDNRFTHLSYKPDSNLVLVRQLNAPRFIVIICSKRDQEKNIFFLNWKNNKEEWANVQNTQIDFINMAIDTFIYMFIYIQCNTNNIQIRSKRKVIIYME